MNIDNILFGLNIITLIGIIFINSILFMKLKGTTWVWIRVAQIVMSMASLVILVQEISGRSLGLTTYLGLLLLLLITMFMTALGTLNKTQVVDHQVRKTEEILNGSAFQEFAEKNGFKMPLLTKENDE